MKGPRPLSFWLAAGIAVGGSVLYAALVGWEYGAGVPGGFLTAMLAGAVLAAAAGATTRRRRAIGFATAASVLLVAVGILGLMTIGLVFLVAGGCAAFGAIRLATSGEPAAPGGPATRSPLPGAPKGVGSRG